MTSSTTGRRNRSKGQTYERRVRDQLAEAMPGTTWTRRIQVRGARVDGSDVEGVDVRGVAVPLWIECHDGRTSPAIKLEQACEDCPRGWHPLAVVHRPATRYAADVVCIRFGDLLDLGMLPPATLDDDGLNTPVTLPLDQALRLIGRWWRMR